MSHGKRCRPTEVARAPGWMRQCWGQRWQAVIGADQCPPWAAICWFSQNPALDRYLRNLQEPASFSGTQASMGGQGCGEPESLITASGREMSQRQADDSFRRHKGETTTSLTFSTSSSWEGEPQRDSAPTHPSGGRSTLSALSDYTALPAYHLLKCKGVAPHSQSSQYDEWSLWPEGTMQIAESPHGRSTCQHPKEGRGSSLWVSG